MRRVRVQRKKKHRKGRGKGQAFERLICKALSKWLSDGAREDLFWRSSLSGGRATVAHRKGVSIRQAGDICAVAAEGHILTDAFFLECKFVKNLAVQSFFLTNKGLLASFWQIACREAAKHKRVPLLIAKENGWKWPVVLVPVGILSGRFGVSPRLKCPQQDWELTSFDNLMKQGSPPR